VQTQEKAWKTTRHSPTRALPRLKIQTLKQFSVKLHILNNGSNADRTLEQLIAWQITFKLPNFGQGQYH